MVDQIPIHRIRYATSHPNSFTPQLFDTMASLEHLCDQLHLPVQSGSNRILQALERNYTREEYLEKIAYYRSLHQDSPLPPFVSTDIIVGFPGETEEDFQQTLELMRTVRFDGAFMFKYSPRRGTPAAEMTNRWMMTPKPAVLIS